MFFCKWLTVVYRFLSDNMPPGQTPHTIMLFSHNDLVDAVQPGDRYYINTATNHCNCMIVNTWLEAHNAADCYMVGQLMCLNNPESYTSWSFMPWWGYLLLTGPREKSKVSLLGVYVGSWTWGYDIKIYNRAFFSEYITHIYCTYTNRFFFSG